MGARSSASRPASGRQGWTSSDPTVAIRPETEERYCSVSGCERPEEAGGLCFGHRYRAKHGLPMAPPLKERVSPFERVVDAMEAFFRADEDDDYRRAKARLRAACWDWLLPRGPRRRRHRLPRRREH